jgi:hypothetical protein
MFRMFGPSAPRSFSGVSSSLGGEVDWRAVAAAFHLLLAMTAALWLARVEVTAAFMRFIGIGLALSLRARSRGGGSSGGEVNGTVAVVTATPDVSVAGVEGGEDEGDEGEGGEGEGGEGKGGEGEGGEGKGGEGEGLSSASLLLSSLRLALLACSRLLLPEWCMWAWVAVSAAAESPPAADARNQKVTSSVHPSVSSTSFAGIPPLLQRTHAMYWLCTLGGRRGPV